MCLLRMALSVPTCAQGYFPWYRFNSYGAPILFYWIQVDQMNMDKITWHHVYATKYSSDGKRSAF